MALTYHQQYYITNQDHIKQRVKKYKQANPDKVNQWNKEHDERRPDLKKERQARNHKRHYSERKERIRDNALQRLYGISLRAYEDLVEAQHGLCAICQLPPPKREVRNGGIAEALCVDHDHETGKIRRLLCPDCNLAIGCIEKNRTLLPMMLQYLDDFTDG